MNCDLYIYVCINIATFLKTTYKTKVDITEKIKKMARSVIHSYVLIRIQSLYSIIPH